jgi:hypothetical protein
VLVPVQRLLILCGRPAGVLGADPAMAAVAVVLPRHVGEQKDPVFSCFVELEEGVSCLDGAAAAHDVRYGPGDFSAAAWRHPDDSGSPATGAAGEGLLAVDQTVGPWEPFVSGRLSGPCMVTLRVHDDAL